MLILALAFAAAAAVPAATPSWAYQGTVGKLEVRLYLEQTPAGLRGLYYYEHHRGELAPDLTLEGTAADGTVSLKEADSKGTETGRFALKGTLGGKLDGTWSGGKRQLRAALQPASAMALSDYSTSFRGFIGGNHQVWLNLKPFTDRSLSGDYRYARSTESLKLQGKVTDDNNGFTLDETDGKGKVTGRIVGRYLDRQEIAGAWVSPDGSKRLGLRVSEADKLDEPEQAAGGLMIYPRQEVRAHRACASELTYPEITGGGDHAALNALLKKIWLESDPLSDDDCSPDFSSHSSGVVGFHYETVRGGIITFSLDTWAFTGGVHGNYGSECRLFDLKTSAEVNLKETLDADARAKLSDLVKATLLADNEAKSLTEAGFFKDELELTEHVDLCPSDDALSVEFDPYEIGPYSMGPVVAQIPYEKARPLFPHTPLTDAILGR